jgi:hypothetical protein
MKKNEKTLWEMLESIKRANIEVIEIQEGF